MKLEAITHGLVILLEQNHYHENTIKFYKREWEKIENFLLEQYGNTEFSMERGLSYLKLKYNIPNNYDRKTLSRQRAQLLRVVNGLLSIYLL